MKRFNLTLNLELIATQIPGELKEINELELNNVAQLDEADAHSICFYENSKYLEQLLNSKAGLVFVPKDFEKPVELNTNLYLVDKPYIYFMMLVKKWLELDDAKSKAEISASATIDSSAKIGKNVDLQANVVIGKNVVIGDNTCIEANCVIKENVVIGKGCHFYPNVTIYHDCKIEDNVILHSGVVIGADGFGFLLHDGIQQKIPQVGNVIIKSDVEIGANSCVDRATLGSTIIGNHTKLDNLVQVGHNCKIGENNILCAQVGLAGNTVIKSRSYLAGQVGVAGHLTIGSDVLIGAQSGVVGDVEDKSKIFGTPAINAGTQKRIMVSLPKLPQIIKDLRKLKK